MTLVTLSPSFTCHRKDNKKISLANFPENFGGAKVEYFSETPKFPKVQLCAFFKRTL
jgi:hypothetical protein